LPGRGLLSAACLVLIALSCIALVRKLERERRLLRKLRASRATDRRSAIALASLSPDERDCSLSLARAGVLTIEAQHCYIRAVELPGFWRKRLRLALSGALGAALLAAAVAALILHR
jgi:hypothetical protein